MSKGIKNTIQKMINTAPSQWVAMFKHHNLGKKPKVDQLIAKVLEKTPSGASSGQRGEAKHKVPKKVRQEAFQGLLLAHKHNWSSKSGIGLVRAMQLVLEPKIWDRSIKRMDAFFTRHAKNKESAAIKSGKQTWGPQKPSRGYIAHLAWGGDSGQKWASKQMKKTNPSLTAEDRFLSDLRKMTVNISANIRSQIEIHRGEIFALKKGDCYVVLNLTKMDDHKTFMQPMEDWQVQEANEATESQTFFEGYLPDVNGIYIDHIQIYPDVKDCYGQKLGWNAMQLLVQLADKHNVKLALHFYADTSDNPNAVQDLEGFYEAIGFQFSRIGDLMDWYMMVYPNDFISLKTNPRSRTGPIIGRNWNKEFVRTSPEIAEARRLLVERPVDRKSPEFVEWFGDSVVKSKHRGVPTIVYRGTSDIRNFIKTGTFRGGSRYLGPEAADKAYFFTDKYAIAKTYATDKRPLDFRSAIPAVAGFYLRMENPLVIDGEGRSFRKTEKFIKKAYNAGYDGLIIENTLDAYNVGTTPSTVYVVWTAKNVKLADGRDGPYGETNDTRINPQIRLVPKEQVRMVGFTKAKSKAVEKEIPFVLGFIEQMRTESLQFPTPIRAMTESEFKHGRSVVDNGHPMGAGHGQINLNTNEIAINPNMKVFDLVANVFHENLHYAFPDWSEEDVRDATGMAMKNLYGVYNLGRPFAEERKKNPQDYFMEHRPASPEYGGPLHDLTQIYSDDIYGPYGRRYYGTGMGDDAKEWQVVKRTKGKPDAPVRIYRSIPASVRANRQKIFKGDWVALNINYVLDHAAGGFGDDGDDYLVLSAVVPASTLWTEGNSIQEWGYWPIEGSAAEQLGYADLGTKFSILSKALIRKFASRSR